MFLLPMLLRDFRAEAGTEEPKFLEKHREPGLFSLPPSRSENWAHNTVEKELSNLNFSFLVFFKIHLFYLSISLGSVLTDCIAVVVIFLQIEHLESRAYLASGQNPSCVWRSSVIKSRSEFSIENYWNSQYQLWKSVCVLEFLAAGVHQPTALAYWYLLNH